MYRLLLLFVFNSVLGGPTYPERVIICGIAKNVEKTLPNCFKNIEELGSRFSDYRVIIYQNNSGDRTADLLSQWAATNGRVLFLSETVPSEHLPLSRTESIARARNVVLSAARRQDYEEYKYLIMADLDISSSWPIDEIMRTVERSAGVGLCVCKWGSFDHSREAEIRFYAPTQTISL